MRESQIVVVADFLQVAILEKPHGGYQAIVYAEDNFEWLTAGLLSELQDSIASRVDGLKHTSVQVRHMTVSKFYLQLIVELPGNITRSCADQYRCRIKEVLKDQPKMFVRKGEQKTPYVNRPQAASAI